MQDFNTTFPHFLERCLDLKGIVTPIAYVLLTGGLIATTLTTHRGGTTHLKIFGRLVFLIVLIVYLPTWGNQFVSVVDDTVKNVLKVDPSKIHDQYKAALELKKSAGTDKSWWEKIMDWRAAPLEWILTGVFMVLGWFASSFMWWAYILQSTILFLGYALSPIFIGTMAFPSLQNNGRRYLLHLVGVAVWPLGWGVAGLITEGMIDFMTDRSFLSTTVIGNDMYSLQNLMGVAFLGIWILFSTIAAPVVIQRSVESGISVAASMLSGAFAAGKGAFAAGTSTFAAAGMGKSGTGLIQAGIVAAAAAGESVTGSALNNGSGSLVGSLAQMKAFQEPHVLARAEARGRFPQNDPTGDKTVEDLLRKTRNPYSS